MNLFQEMAVAVAIVAAAWDLEPEGFRNVLTFGGRVGRHAVHGFREDGARLACRSRGGRLAWRYFSRFLLWVAWEPATSNCSAAVGACVGPLAAVWVALFTSIAGGVMALAVASYSGYLRQGVREPVVRRYVLAARGSSSSAGNDARHT